MPSFEANGSSCPRGLPASSASACSMDAAPRRYSAPGTLKGSPGVSARARICRQVALAVAAGNAQGPVSVPGANAPVDESALEWPQSAWSKCTQGGATVPEPANAIGISGSRALRRPPSTEPSPPST